MKLEAEQRDKNRGATQKIKDKELEMENLTIEAEVELKKLRLRPLHTLGGPERTVQILEAPSFHTLTNIRKRWIAI